jgi:hypothetical protein
MDLNKVYNNLWDEWETYVKLIDEDIRIITEMMIADMCMKLDFHFDSSEHRKLAQMCMREKYCNDRCGEHIVAYELLGISINAFKKELAMKGMDYEIREWTEDSDIAYEPPMRTFRIMRKFTYDDDVFVELAMNITDAVCGVVWEAGGDFLFWKYDAATEHDVTYPSVEYDDWIINAEHTHVALVKGTAVWSRGEEWDEEFDMIADEIRDKLHPIASLSVPRRARIHRRRDQQVALR